MQVPRFVSPPRTGASLLEFQEPNEAQRIVWELQEQESTRCTWYLGYGLLLLTTTIQETIAAADDNATTSCAVQRLYLGGGGRRWKNQPRRK